MDPTARSAAQQALAADGGRRDHEPPRLKRRRLTDDESSRLTADLDILYDRFASESFPLIVVIASLDPYLRGALPVFRSGSSWRPCKLVSISLVTRLGALDLLGELTGGGSYDALLPHSVVVAMFGLSVRCLSLGQLIATKRAVGRPRDLDALAELEVIREERGRGE